ncbi:oocyte zinc finger protein XlCOF8.4-like [Dendropsophus ebraccatus]|uniref:oocyte zinc finger protein XlCOF8.4-like n=1 Tax=Dendropsophus ebraccatus TaxID=150705 RepID=UPI00383211B2
MLDHIASSVMNMALSKEKISEKILNHALEIIYLLTGEKYVLVKKSSPHCCIHPQSGTVPVKCEDVAVYFSMEEWDYVKGHKQQYHSIITGIEPEKMDSTDVGVTKDDDVDEGSSPELEDFQVEEIEYESTSGKDDEDDEEENKEKSKYEQSSGLPGTSAISAGVSSISAPPFRPIMEDPYPVTAHLLTEQEIKEEIIEEIKEDGTYADKLSAPDSASAPHYRWHPNIWSISERFICSGSNRTYEPYAGIKTTPEEKPADPSRLQFMNQVALEEKPFRCIACGQMFKYKSSAMRHYSVVHGVKPHQCSECGRRFSTKFNSVVHKCKARKNSRDFWDDQKGVNVEK